MKYQVKMIQKLIFIVEGNNEEEIQDFLCCNTIEEIRPKLKGYYTEDYDEQIIKQMSNYANENIKI
jgi:hypothetical protein